MILRMVAIILQFLFLPFFSKILERVMYNRLYKYLTDQKILHPQQFGFWKGYSIEHAVAQLVDQIYQSFENNNYTDGVFNFSNRPGPQRGFVPPSEGGCLTRAFEPLIVCSLCNRVVKLMAKWHRASTRGFQGIPTAIYNCSIGKIGKCIIVNMPISSEMLFGLTWNFKDTLT